MPLLFNIRHLEHQTVTLRGELPVAELDLGGIDELIQADSLLQHDLVVVRHERSILVHVCLGLKLRCECVRCLNCFEYGLAFAWWSCLLTLEGDGNVLECSDFVDL